jgi:hypothetical protein
MNHVGVKESSMTNASRTGRLNVDLQEYKQAWLDYCRKHGTTPSKAFRAILEKLIGGGEQPQQSAALNRSARVRKEIRLTADECAQAESIAAREGFNLSRWMVSIVRARLVGGPQLGQQELELLARSNMQILALGRTLNQLAKAAHANPGVLSAFDTRRIEQTAALVREHVACVANVLESNIARWTSK